MQFITSVLALSLAAFASAQSTTVSTSPTTTYALTPQQTCLATCKAGDVNCQAACIGAAHPNSSQVSQTNECAAKCVQGDGSTSQTNLYAQCISACIASYYPTTQTVAAAVSSATTIATVKASGTGSAASSGAVATGKSLRYILDR
jgi:hypothetical protein